MQPALTVSEARRDFADAVNRVAYKKERVLVERHGKVVMGMVPVEDLELLRDLEDRIDLADARAALAEAKKKGTKSLAVFAKELGL
ncbi:MAG: type II toxin-antitoxin system Phd/YefM family antitoxin [Nitrospira sp.]